MNILVRERPLYAYRKGRLKLPPVDPQRIVTQSELWRVDAAGEIAASRLVRGGTGGKMEAVCWWV
jgi:hypothetical protein